MTSNIYRDIIKNNNETSNDLEYQILKNRIYQKKRSEYHKTLLMKHKIIKMKMTNWLLQDYGDNMILLDFLKYSFDILLTHLNVKLSYKKHKIYFTMYCNWIYKYTTKRDYFDFKKYYL